MHAQAMHAEYGACSSLFVHTHRLPHHPRFTYQARMRTRPLTFCKLVSSSWRHARNVLCGHTSASAAVDDDDLHDAEMRCRLGTTMQAQQATSCYNNCLATGIALGRATTVLGLEGFELVFGHLASNREGVSAEVCAGLHAACERTYGDVAWVLGNVMLVCTLCMQPKASDDDDDCDDECMQLCMHSPSHTDSLATCMHALQPQFDNASALSRLALSSSCARFHRCPMCGSRTKARHRSTSLMQHSVMYCLLRSCSISRESSSMYAPHYVHSYLLFNLT